MDTIALSAFGIYLAGMLAIVLWCWMVTSNLSDYILGAVTIVVWKQLSGGIFELYEIVPGFVLCCWIVVVLVSKMSPPHADVAADFDRTGRHGNAGRSRHQT